MSKRTVVAAIVGFVGGLLVVVGTALPWLSITASGDPSSSGFSGDQSLNGLSGVMGILLIPLGVIIMVAAVWLWAGSDGRKMTGLLGASGITAVALAATVLLTKADALGLGFGYPEEHMSVEIGVYVMIGAGVLAIVAAILAALPARTAGGVVGNAPGASV